MLSQWTGAFNKVPQVIPKVQSYFFHIGRFLSHAFVMTGYFPIKLSIVSAKVIICGRSLVTDEELLCSFSRFIDQFEAKVLEKPSNDQLQTVLLPMFNRFNVLVLPTTDNLHMLVKKAAIYALIAKPFLALREIRRGMLSAHPGLWGKISTQRSLMNCMMLFGQQRLVCWQ